MPTKTAKSKTVATRAKPAAQRKPKLTYYVTVIGELVAAMQDYRMQLAIIDAGGKIDLKAFDRTIKALNKAGDQFDALTTKHEETIVDYVDDQTA